MSEGKVVIGLALIVFLFLGGIFAIDMKQKNDKRNPVTNDSIMGDDWGIDNGPVNPDEIVRPDKPQMPQQQIVAQSYKDAIKKSGEHGMPVMVFFEADWCHWCGKMKSEVLTDSKVKTIMKNYILVHVDYDRNKSVARKFGVRGLPAYAITNVNERDLKSDGGYMDAGKFVKWLDNPTMYRQPKQGDRITPPQKPDNRWPKPRPDDDDDNDRRRPG